MAKTKAEYGRGTGRPHPVDVHVGARVRERRMYLGMNQETLAAHMGLTFQQVQKYESGANRVSASRLAHLAVILDVPVEYFFAAFGHSPHSDHAPDVIRAVRLFNEIADPAVQSAFMTLLNAAERASP